MSTSMVVPVRWPAPDAIGAFSSTRRGGVSSGSFASLNLSAGAGDAAANVAENVARLTAACALPHTPHWPRQVHGSAVVEASSLPRAAVQADAVFTSRPGVICSVRTADCLPVLLCARDASAVAAAHAGWRGLAAGVLEAVVSALQVPPAAILAWLGPAIGPGRWHGVRTLSARPLAGGSLHPCAPAPARRRCARDSRRRLLHLHRPAALLLLPPRRRQRTHGFRDLDQAAGLRRRA
jgi:hypothetical protein